MDNEEKVKEEKVKEEVKVEKVKAIINGYVMPMAGPDLPGGTVLIKSGKILAVGNNDTDGGGITVSEDAEIIDATGKYVLPGFIDAHCHVGILEEIYPEGNDLNEMTDPVTPHLRAIDAINPEDEGFCDAVAGGVTTVITGPGSGNVVGGENLAMKTHGRVIDEMVLKAPIGLKVAFGENPKRVHGRNKKMPSTRMGTAALLREALVQGQNYLRKLAKGEIDPDKMPDRDLRMEAVARVLRREIPLRAHAHRADDIMTAIRIAEEFGVELVIEHCTEGHKIADILAEKNVRVITGPSLSNRSKVELKDRTMETPGILARTGIKLAIMTDHPVIPLNYLSLCAALAVREGLEEREALQAITTNAAEICGIAGRVGSLEPGKDADVIILNGPPLALTSRVEKVFIEGKQVYEYPVVEKP